MNAIPAPPSSSRAASPERTLRRLFLTLFLRGRSSRGLRRESAPRSVGSKLALTLVIYGMVGLFALVFLRQPVFSLAVYLHAMTLVFLGMFVAASAGEVLFNKEEADILLHRPVTSRALLWAKIGVLVEVSIWLAGAFNLAGLFIGVQARDGGWLFPVAHAVSTVIEALFCTGCVVVIYQLCLRWFGRERLDGLMTTAQVLVAVAAVAGSQAVPQMIGLFGGRVHLGINSWWVALLPPAWFAGFDDALAGRGAGGSWALAAFGFGATAVVLWLAFGKLARDYETGLQTLGEAKSPPARFGRRRWIDFHVNTPPLRWWLRDSVTRAAFLLTAAYLIRDRDVKLRIYPGLAPMLVFPMFFLFRDLGGGSFHESGFGVAFAGGYLGLIPLMGLNLLQYSQQWQASDIFRVAPLRGPARLCDGARRAVLSLLALPTLILFGMIAWLVNHDYSRLPLLLPGIITLPVYALLPSRRGQGVPLSLPTEEAQSAGRGLTMFGVVVISMALSGVATWAWSTGWFWELLLAETVVVAVIYTSWRAAFRSVLWTKLE
jgi:ABC-2 type transport system permease protein